MKIYVITKGDCQVLCPECTGTVLRHYDYKKDWSDVE